MAWHRYERALTSQAANQAVLVWATCGEIIGLAMRPHRERAQIENAHRSLSTGVIAHTIHFTDRLDASQWLLIVTEATKAAAGRVFGDGRVFTPGGALVATFHQDAMAKAAELQLDPKRSM
jgi:acyl-CoA thioesterase II